ncbi:MAG: hypothetical protein IJR36_09995, partial [Lachnospiraceae bacterium]|nr:hypothetical protein [Lachnospiraceae bacterium]
LSTQREYTYSLGNVGYAISQSHFSYDSANRVTEQRYKSTYSGGGTATGPRYYRYTYSNTDGSLTKLTHSYFDLNYSYDGLKRLGSRTLKKDGTALLTRNYTYTAGAGTNGASFLVSKVESRDKNSNVLRSYTYTYDDNGNITAVSGSDAAAYTYDGQNQLLSETKGGVTTSFTYDAAGNILTRTKGGVTDTYTYGDSEWKDLLTAYNNHTITYDAIGNPTAWYDGSSFTWSYGRKLTGITNGSTSISYSYYADGRRLSKTVGSTTTTFNWVGDMLFSTYQNDGTTFEFLYDESGHPAGFWYKQGSGDWNLYFYVTNLQGDITKIIDEDGSSIGTYSYDAWGKVTSVSGTIAQANPLRYRGYYYDEETGFYQLGSRYYDPEIGRFVSADDADVITEDPFEITDKNLFAYCDNNPVLHIDREGEFWDEVTELGKAIMRGGIMIAGTAVAIAGGAVVVGSVIATGGASAAAIAGVLSETAFIAMETSAGCMIVGSGITLLGVGKRLPKRN